MVLTFKDIISKLTPKDVIAIIIIIGSLILLGLGKDSTVSMILIAIVGFYFGINRIDKK